VKTAAASLRGSETYPGKSSVLEVYSCICDRQKLAQLWRYLLWIKPLKIALQYFIFRAADTLAVSARYSETEIERKRF
jgi:hypothetical protein